MVGFDFFVRSALPHLPPPCLIFRPAFFSLCPPPFIVTQAADINALFGFRLECMERLGDPHGVWAWTRFNTLFNYLPLAALIEDRILCMHGGELWAWAWAAGGGGGTKTLNSRTSLLSHPPGIGRSISSIDQIATLQRPLTMEDGGIVLMDLLWSDPTTNDAVEGVQPSPRGPGLVTFGPDRVKQFCKDNDLQLIVRAHECVMDGFERFAQGHLITLFSATNYCGTANNAGKGLKVGPRRPPPPPVGFVACLPRCGGVGGPGT